MIQGLAASVTSTIQMVRRMATNLRPSVLDQVGLLEAIELYAKDFQTRSGIEVRVEASLGEVALDPAERTALFRIVQESLTNVSRYARASEVRVTIEQTDTSLILRIADNGVGFDPAVVRGRSLGLLGMEERANLIGARFNVSSTPGSGTTVVVQLPLNRRRVSV